MVLRAALQLREVRKGHFDDELVGSKLDARKGFVDFDALGEVILSEWTAHGAQELTDHERRPHARSLCLFARGLAF